MVGLALVKLGCSILCLYGVYLWATAKNSETAIIGFAGLMICKVLEKVFGKK